MSLGLASADGLAQLVSVLLTFDCSNEEKRIPFHRNREHANVPSNLKRPSEESYRRVRASLKHMSVGIHVLFVLSKCMDWFLYRDALNRPALSGPVEKRAIQPFGGLLAMLSKL